jgi:23S rRNA (cytosine1962-C5)-methyltransferase
MMNLPRVILQKDQHRRLLAGHDWVYSNEIDNHKSPLKSFEPGSLVDYVSQHGKWVGRGYLNPHTLIAGRILTRRHAEAIDERFLAQRIEDALLLRTRLYPAPFYRLVYGESDGLPGLVVDRFGEVLVMQVGTAGMERLLDPVVSALVKSTGARSVVLRNDTANRELEGLPPEVRVVHGPDVSHAELREGGLVFSAPVLDGQKTGWFFDQADNRSRLVRYLRGGRVLDVFAYLGAWGLRAAKCGATEVTCVDSSRSALAAIEEAARRNGLGQVRTEQGDAFDVLEGLHATGQTFETVIVDPPAFIKRRKDEKTGASAYERINLLALRLIAPGGTLVAASCSHHLHRDEFIRVVQRAARRAERELRLLEQGGQGPDHPIQPAMPETEYLKALYFCVD